MTNSITESTRPFRKIRICNMKSIRWTKLEKLAINGMDQSIQPTRRTKNFLKNQPDFSRTCGFRGNFTKSLNFHFKPSKIAIVGLYFHQNPLKVEKWPFLA